MKINPTRIFLISTQGLSVNLNIDSFNNKITDE